MKTFIWTLAFSLILTLQGVTARADLSTAEGQLRAFATCAGRLSAQMEFQWMVDGPASEETKRRRATLIELLTAIMPADRGREVLAWRINAKAAHSALLTRAQFGRDADDAQWAATLADRLTADCTGLLTG